MKEVWVKGKSKLTLEGRKPTLGSLGDKLGTDLMLATNGWKREEVLVYAGGIVYAAGGESK